MASSLIDHLHLATTSAEEGLARVSWPASPPADTNEGKGHWCCWQPEYAQAVACRPSQQSWHHLHPAFTLHRVGRCPLNNDRLLRFARAELQSIVRWSFVALHSILAAYILHCCFSTTASMGSDWLLAIGTLAQVLNAVVQIASTFMLSRDSAQNRHEEHMALLTQHHEAHMAALERQTAEIRRLAPGDTPQAASTAVEAAASRVRPKSRSVYTREMRSHTSS